MQNKTARVFSDSGVRVNPILNLLIGAIAAIKVNVVGEIYVGEILAVAYVVSNLPRVLLYPGIRWILFGAGSWAIAQTVSDLLNDTPWGDMLKGVGAPLLLGATVGAVFLHVHESRGRLRWLLIGAAVSAGVFTSISSNEYVLGNPWKWAYGPAILSAFAIWHGFFLRKGARSSAVVLIVFSVSFLVIGVVNDSRSLSTFPLIATALYFGRESKAVRWMSKHVAGRFGFLKALAVSLFAIVALNAGATYMFSLPEVLARLSDESARKFQYQAAGEYGVLLGGRSEILASAQAFFDSPLLGHGSWAKDNAGYSDQLAAAFYSLGYGEGFLSASESELIPVHSYFMGALVWSGVVGGLFWILLVRWLLRSLLAHVRMLNFYALNGGVLLMWNILFSPFGAVARWETAVFLAAFAALLDQEGRVA